MLGRVVDGRVVDHVPRHLGVGQPVVFRPTAAAVERVRQPDRGVASAIVEPASEDQPGDPSRSIEAIDDVGFLVRTGGEHHALVAGMLVAAGHVALFHRKRLISPRLELGPKDDRVGLAAEPHVDGVSAQAELRLGLAVEHRGRFGPEVVKPDAVGRLSSLHRHPHENLVTPLTGSTRIHLRSHAPRRRAVRPLARRVVVV